MQNSRHLSLAFFLKAQVTVQILAASMSRAAGSGLVSLLSELPHTRCLQTGETSPTKASLCEERGVRQENAGYKTKATKKTRW